MFIFELARFSNFVQRHRGRIVSLYEGSLVFHDHGILCQDLITLAAFLRAAPFHGLYAVHVHELQLFLAHFSEVLLHHLRRERSATHLADVRLDGDENGVDHFCVRKQVLAYLQLNVAIGADHVVGVEAVAQT